MKKVTLYTTLMLLTLTAGGCKDEFVLNGSLQPALVAKSLYVSPVEFEYSSSDAVVSTVNVESKNVRWEFVSVPDYMTVTPPSGTGSAAVALAVAENTDTQNNRITAVYFRSIDPAWPFSRPVVVSQGRAAARVELSRQSVDFSGAAGSADVQVTANCSWQAICSATWAHIEADADRGVLKVSVDPNQTASSRSTAAYVSFTDRGMSRSVRLDISQTASTVTTADPLELRAENVAGRFNMEINSEAPWTAAAYAAWLQITPSTGQAGKCKLSIDVAPNTDVNERTGYVAFKTGTAEKLRIKVVQRGIYIEADPKLEFTSAAGGQDFAVRSNTDWQVLQCPAWLTLDKRSGSGSATLHATCGENPNSTPRSGQIIIGQNGLSIQAVIAVSQAGKYLRVSNPTMQFTDRAGSQKFNIESDALWASSCPQQWLGTTPVSGSGNAEITVSVQENESVDERSADISYTYAETLTKVSVFQQAKYFTVSNSMTQYASRGGTLQFDFSTNDSWTVTTSAPAPWLKLSKTQGQGNATVTATADDNPSVNPRSVELIFTPRCAQAVRFVLTQQPRHLAVSQQSLLFFASGGTSEAVTVTTDGEYTVTTDAAWLTVNRLTGDIFTVTAPVNPTSEFRSATIKVALTDLTEDKKSIEIPVMQACKGGSFVKNGYEQDGNWDKNGDNSFNLNVNDYIGDGNWDKNGDNSFNLNVNDYIGDGNWDKNGDNSFNLSINGYPEGDDNWNKNTPPIWISLYGYMVDQNWDANLGSTIKLTVTGYPTDESWNRNSNSNISVGGNGYNSDSNWNRNTNSGISVGGNGYNSDSNWNRNSNSGISVGGNDYPTDESWN